VKRCSLWVRAEVMSGEASQSRTYREKSTSRWSSRESLQADRPVRVGNSCQTVAPGAAVEGGGVTIVVKSLHSNAELVVRQSPTIKDVNTEAGEATSVEVVTRQPVKTQYTEETSVGYGFVQRYRFL
jgi:hypothetical protein